jgi:hypothetical protein
MKNRLSPLHLEALEDRMVPTTYGVPWPNAQNLTLSFVPDGTSVAGQPSDLNALMSTTGSQSAWEMQILKAAQSWAAVSNVNITLVPDDGEPLGTSGLVQGDPRFGDIRIAAAPMAGPSVVATTVPFSYTGSTWSGDIVFNSDYTFSLGNVAGQDNLYSVAVHELGHALSLPDNYTDPASVMAPSYSYLTGLSQSDVANIQALYGARLPSQFAASSLAGAFNLGQGQNTPTVLSQISRIGETHYFQFTAPAASTTVQSLTLNLQVSGHSMLVPSLTVYDGLGNIVSNAAASDPTAGDLNVTLPNFVPGMTYYAEIAGARNDMFGVGAYQLNFQYRYATPPPPPPAVAPASNFTYISAVSLQSDGTDTHLQANGSMATPTESHYFYFTAPSNTTASNIMTVAVNATQLTGLCPVVTIYNSQLVPIAATVVENEEGSYTVQATNIQAGMIYYCVVTTNSATSNNNVGPYRITVDVNNYAAVQYASLASGTLTQAAPEEASTLTVPSAGGLYNFSLSAQTANSSVASAIQMTVYNSSGQVVFTLVANSGQGVVTGTALLGSGTYTVSFSAATQNGSALPSLAYALGGVALSGPLDPFPVTNPTQPPCTAITDPPPIVSNPITSITLPPISNPYILSI